MGSGLPCLAVELPYITEINNEAKAITVYKKGDAEDLASKIRHLLESNNNQKAREAVGNYASNHTVVDFVNQHLKIYSTLET